jgi:hypothetical protein
MPAFSSAPAGATALVWRRFALTCAAAAAAVMAALFGFVLAIDPYGTRVGPSRTPRPIMDLNQRFMYPQIVRSGRYDSAIFGTSTIRLLDPKQLGTLFEASFANLGLNAGTPWEQIQLAALFLKHVPRPKVMIFGLDTTWCEPDADRKRLTFRAFPPWLYDENPINDWPGLLNLKSVEIASRVLLNWLGFMPPRIGPEGFEIFVPPENAYDLARARSHIGAFRFGGAEGEPLTAALVTPALAWLDDLLARIPSATNTILMFPPVHAAAQPPAGSRTEAVDEECKARIAEIARMRDASLLDFRRRSAVTTDDSNYWDALHYRIGIAQRIATALRNPQAGNAEPSDGFYRVLTQKDRPASPGQAP